VFSGPQKLTWIFNSLPREFIIVGAFSHGPLVQETKFQAAPEKTG
jgi:hypothetical protein